LVVRKAAVSDEEKIFQKEKDVVEKDYSIMDEQMLLLKNDRETILPNVETPFLADYQKLLMGKRGVAVVALQGGHCSGCHMNIPPQLFTEVKRNDRIQHCPNCQRIIYWKC
jgi:hypothetical protein